MDTLDILVLLDRSGSMNNGRADHEGGLRSFVEDQRALPGDVRFTFIQFDGTNACEIIYDRVPIADVTDIRLVPRGSTPLYAAVGLALAHLEDKQAKEPATSTVVMVITDGQNTDYHADWPAARVKTRIAELEQKGWSFLFLGAGPDAFAEYEHMGMPMASAATYTVGASTINNVYAVTSNKMSRARSSSAGVRGMSSVMSFDDIDAQSFTGVNAAPVAFDNITKKAADKTGTFADTTPTHTTGEQK